MKRLINKVSNRYWVTKSSASFLNSYIFTCRNNSYLKYNYVGDYPLFRSIIPTILNIVV